MQRWFRINFSLSEQSAATTNSLKGTKSAVKRNNFNVTVGKVKKLWISQSVARANFLKDKVGLENKFSQWYSGCWCRPRVAYASLKDQSVGFDYRFCCQNNVTLQTNFHLFDSWDILARLRTIKYGCSIMMVCFVFNNRAQNSDTDLKINLKIIS